MKQCNLLLHHVYVVAASVHQYQRICDFLSVRLELAVGLGSYVMMGSYDDDFVVTSTKLVVLGVRASRRASAAAALHFSTSTVGYV